MAAPSRRTSTSSIPSRGMTTCGTPLLMKWTLLFLSPTRSVTFSRKSVGSVICNVTRSPLSSAAITPAGVSKEIFPCASATLFAKRAKQRAPLLCVIYSMHFSSNTFRRGTPTAVARRDFGGYLFRVRRPAPWIFVVILGLRMQIAFAADCNDLILDQIKQMPTGGRYSVSHFAKIRLQSSAHFESV